VRLLAAAPDASVRDGGAAMSLLQPLAANGPRTYQLAEMMAMVLAEMGQYADAISWQREAIAGAERAQRPDAAREMTVMLRTYEQRHPCRTPWRRNEPPGAS
jgi:hypothetical protein